MIALVHSKEVCPLPNPPPLSREREPIPRFISFAQKPTISVPSPATRGRDREGGKSDSLNNSVHRRKALRFFHADA